MIVFASDVHLGLRKGDPAEREHRFVAWLRDLALGKGDSLFLLGDIWDFWYEYKYVVPKDGIRVIAALLDLMDRGVDVYFAPGNHDIWCFHWFEELGMHKIDPQPAVFELEGKKFMVAHGDGLGNDKKSFLFLRKIFHSKFCQALFSTLHPRLAFSFALRWSDGNRRTHGHYVWKGKEEKLYRYACSQPSDIEYFISQTLITWSLRSISKSICAPRSSFCNKLTSARHEHCLVDTDPIPSACLICPIC